MKSHIGGFQKRHAYTLIDVFSHQQMQRIKVRNPWGNGQKVGHSKLEWGSLPIAQHRQQCTPDENWLEFK